MIHETIALLRDDSLPWCDEMDTIRKPLAALLLKLEQTPSHQFDDEVDELCRAITLTDYQPDDMEPLQRWVEDSVRQLGIFVELNKRERMAQALRRLFDGFK